MLRRAAVLALGLLLAIAGAAWAEVPTNLIDGTTLNFDTGAVVSLSAQGAGTVNSADQTNSTGRGVVCVFNQSSHTGTPSTTFAIQGKDPGGSGQYFTYVTSGAITNDATPTPLVVARGTPTTANISDGRPLTHIWRVTTTVGGTTPSVNATIGCTNVN